jgi:hypothetical protein
LKILVFSLQSFKVGSETNHTTKDKSLWKFLSHLILRTFWVNNSLLAISHQSSERSLAASSALVARASDQEDQLSRRFDGKSGEVNNIKKQKS